MFVEFHMLQNFAPSNLNRDDTNNPKECEFGGTRRARISSQCLKRSIRTHPIFAATTAIESGTRTRWLTQTLTMRLIQAGRNQEDAENVALAFAGVYAKKTDKKNRTAVLLYLSEEEIATFTNQLLANWTAALEEANGAKGEVLNNIVAELVKNTKNRTSAPDIAMFGRMLAERPELNMDAACQVAHAISTHRINMEIDFFTAVDDLQQDNGEETGAGMMGIIGFNSATFYRYARLDWDQLVRNLGGNVELAHKTVEGFMRAAVIAVPTGKQNTFAAHNPPSFVLAVARQDGMSWSLANAFEKPVYPSKGLVAPSVEALDAYWGNLCRVYGTDGLIHVSALTLDESLNLNNLNEVQVENLEQLIQDVQHVLATEVVA